MTFEQKQRVRRLALATIQTHLESASVLRVLYLARDLEALHGDPASGARQRLEDWICELESPPPVAPNEERGAQPR